jgi:hypothetical protein
MVTTVPRQTVYVGVMVTVPVCANEILKMIKRKKRIIIFFMLLLYILYQNQNHMNDFNCLTKKDGGM